MPMLNQTTITLGQAKTSVARVGGGQSDADQLTIASEVIRDVLLDFNNVRDWTWLQNSTTGTVTTNGLFALPSRYKKIYSLTVPNKTLSHITQRDFNRQVVPGQSIGETAYYSEYLAGQGNVLELLDHPTASVVASCYYQMMVNFPTADGNAFELPEQAMSYILARSKADYLATRGGSEIRLQYFAARAQEMFTALVVDDQRKLDEDAAFTPGVYAPASVNWRNYPYDT